MNKVYTRINWENYPSEKTAVNESNLNKMDSALNEIDKRVVEHETTKANVASLNNLIDDWHIDETTGVITIHKVSGEQIIFDLNLEKVPVGFSMTDDGILIMTTDDGTEFTANIGSMIPILTFNDSEQIAVAVSGEGVNKSYTFTIKTGSISEDKLQPNFLADCRLYAGNAENSALRAEEYAGQAKESAEKNQEIISVINQASKSWINPYGEDGLWRIIYDMGTPNSEKYPPYEYAGITYRYLDVVTGKLYKVVTEIEPNGGETYTWTYEKTCESVQSQLESVQNELATKRNYEYFTLSPNDPNLIAGSERTFSTFNGRKFTDYSTYIFILFFNDSIRTTIEVTQGLFATTSHFTVSLSTVDSANVQCWAEVNWASDTSYKVNASSNLSGRDPKVFVFGCH